MAAGSSNPGQPSVSFSSKTPFHSKMCYMHTMDDDLAESKDKDLTRDATCITLENHVLSEGSRTRKVTDCMIPFV